MIGDTERLEHMIEACDTIMGFGNDAWDRKTYLAAERCIEILGEASRHLSDHVKQSCSEVIWQDIIGMRNIIAHEYFRTQDPIIYRVSVKYVPVLRTQLIDILQKLKSAS